MCEREAVQPGETLDLATTWALARAWYHDRLREDWEPRSREASQAILTSLGLVGRSWTLPL